MAQLLFKVSADYEKVIKLREEIAKLKQELISMDIDKSADKVKVLEDRLGKATGEFNKLTSEAAKAGAEMEMGLKKKIFDASQTVNVFSEKITFQRGTIQQLKNELSGLKDKYREALKQDGDTSSLEAKIKSTSAKLRDQKDTLFNLTQQQANARLSVKKLRDEYELYNNDGKNVVATNENMAISWKKALAVIGGVAALKQLSSAIIRVRGEFQSMQTAIETMVGKDRAGQLIPQIKELAKISPLTMTDMVGAEKMMLGFNIQAEDTIKYLKALSDISMGESGKFNSLTLAFSQMSAAGKLMGQDLNQMINAGFNPLQVIAEKTGKSIATLKDEMSKGAISAEMVQQAFIDATSAGGKFYGMSENASKTINGQISMMQDAWDNALNEIGQKSEGFIMGTIQGATKLIQNYEKVGKVLVGLIVTLGIYKTALLVTDVLNNNIIAHKRLSAVIGVTTKAVKGLSAAMKANPYIALASVVIGVGSAIYAFSEKTNKASRANAELTANIQQETKGLDDLFKKLKNAKSGTDDRKKAIDQINSKYPTYLGNLLTEKSTVEEIATAYEEAKKKIIEYNLEKSRDKYLLEPLEGLSDATKDFYVSLDAFLRKLDNDTQRGKFKVYVDQLVESVKDGDYFSMDKFENAFRAAQAKGNYKNTDEWLDAFRAGKEEYGENILRKIGGWDYGNLKRAGQGLEAYSKSLRKAQKEFDEFAKSYTETGKPAPVKSSTYAKDLATARKEWEDAKKALAAIEKDKDKFTTKQYEDAKKKKETTEKRYKDLGGVVDMTSKDNSISDQSSKIAELEKKQAKDRIRQAEDLEDQIAQSKIDAEANSFKKIQMQRELDNKKELQAIKRRKEDYIQAYIQAQKELFNAKEDLKTKKDKNYKKKTFDSSSVVVDTSGFDAIEENTRRKQARSALDIQDRAWNEYLTKYGDYQERRLAITKQYEEKIKEAVAEGEKKTLQKEMEDMISSINLSEFKNSISWDSIFGDLSLYSAKKLKELRNQLRELIETDKSLSVTDKTALIDQYNKLGDAIIRDQNALGKLFDYKTEQQKQVQLLKEEYELRKKIYDNLVKEKSVIATRHLSDKIKLEEFLKSNGINSGSSSMDFNQISSLLSGKGDAKGLEQFKSLFSLFNKSGSELSNVTAKVGEAGKSMQGASSALKGAGSSAAGTVAIIDKIIHGINDNVQSANELLHILEVEDTKFGKGFDSFAKSSQYATQAWESLKSGNIMGVAAGVAGSIKELGNAVGSWFGWNADYSQYNKMKEQYDALNSIWDELIDKKKEYIGISYGAEADKVGKEALELAEKSIESYHILGRERLNSGASKGSHSIGIRQRKGMSREGWDELRKAARSIGFDYNSVAGGRMTGLFDLSTEQLEKLKLEAPTFWAKLDGEVREYLDNIIEGQERIEDIQTQIQEQLTQTTFDSVYDNFVDSLMDMKAEASDFSDDLSEMFMRSILSNEIGNKYYNKLKEWYSKWSEAMKLEDETKRKLELDKLREEYEGYVDSAIKERNDLANTIGYTGDSGSTSQTATKRGVETITQDQAGELTGRITDVQGTTRDIKAHVIQQTETMSILNLKAEALLNTNNNIRNIADETRSILANSYLELRQISDNTGAIITPIKEMNDKLEKIQRNTENL